MITACLNEIDLPIEPLPVESGYFLIADISKCRDLVPAKYFETHDYEDDKNTTLAKNYVYNPQGKIPLDLAFCRWMGVEKKVVMMPNCLFYSKGSPLLTENFVRLAICKGVENTKTALDSLRKWKEA
jgi:hypothetical protein